MIKEIIKSAARFTPVYRTARFLNRHNPAILMYHGLTDDENLNDWTQIRIVDFERQMHYLSSHYNVVPLSELADRIDSNSVPPHTAAITFDDGYLSNLTLALPILASLNLPATVFIASGFVKGYDKLSGFLWPDYITALLRSIKDNRIDLSDLGYGNHRLSTTADKESARSAIAEQLKAATQPDRNKALEFLENRYGRVVNFEDFPEYHPLSPTELKKLSDNPLITIGGHTINHPILSSLHGSELESEIIGCKNELEEIIGQSVDQFAYPNGRLQDISRETLAVTSRTYKCAITTENGLNQSGQNRFLLRRIGIGRNYDLDLFKILLSGVYYLRQSPIRELTNERTGN